MKKRLDFNKKAPFMIKYLCSRDIYHKLFYHKKTFFIPSFELNMKEEEKIFKFLCLLEKSNVSSIIEKKYKKGNRINNKMYKNKQA